MTEIILVLTVSLISIGVLVWLAVLSTRFIKEFIPIVQEILDEKKINRCDECKEPLRNIQTNQWMCQQSPTKCKQSTKVMFIHEEEE